MCKTKQFVNQCVTVVDPQTEADDSETFFIQAISDAKQADKFTVPLKIQGKVIPARLDIGAAVNTVSKKVFLGLGCSRVTRTGVRLAGYGGKPIQIICYAELSIESASGKMSTVKFYVTENNDTLLGVPGIDALELMQINQVSSQSSQLDLKKISTEFAPMFDGLGKFGSAVDLELKPDAIPKAVPSRLVSHNLRHKLRLELDRLSKAGVIVKDTTPTQWTLPLVIVHKPNWDIRLCLDPQYLNKQLVRAPCAIPTTTTEIFASFRFKVFTTLDAKQGFQQIPLSEESSRLTSFITPFGKFRYVRLPMGICNALEIFHQRMVEAVEGLPGVEVYIDDVLVHAATREEHDVSVRHVLERFRQVGLTKSG